MTVKEGNEMKGREFVRELGLVAAMCLCISFLKPECKSIPKIFQECVLW